jgi:carbamoyltransferase
MNRVRSVTILGIHDGHTAGAAVIRDGRVLAAISEERLTNEKNYSGVPRRALAEVVRLADLSPDQIDLIALGCLVRSTAPVQDEQTWRMLLYKRMAPLFQSHLASEWLVKGFHRIRKMGELRQILEELGLGEKEIHFVDHHTTHAACAFYPRPWDEDTLVLTLDGAGDNLCATIHAGRGLRMERIASTTFYHSPGNNLYSEVTGYLGLKRWEHEYKVMGMAPYGRPEVCQESMRKIVRIHPRRPLEFQNTLGAYSTEVQSKLRSLLAGQRFDNIAAACQKYYEDLVTQWVRNAVRETGIHRIACAGGMFLNVKANKLIRELPEVESAFFYPAADDGGTPVGAALEVYFRYCERERIPPKRIPLADLYYGREFSDGEIEQILTERGWKDRAEYVRDPEETAADLLARGKILARFSGRDEWGPRALGNRSILADPRDLRVIRRINFAIKHRDFWMPFAPSILDEYAGSYLLDAHPAPYMIEAFDTTEKAEEIIASLHPFDRTARPQTVDDANPSYRRLLRLFRDRTGVGGVLNTSFNLHGYPVVGSPQTALWTLENSELDGLMMGGWLVRRTASQ